MKAARRRASRFARGQQLTFADRRTWGGRSELLHAAFVQTIRATNARYEDFRVVDYSVQDDRVHALVEADDHAALTRAGCENAAAGCPTDLHPWTKRERACSGRSGRNTA